MRVNNGSKPHWLNVNTGWHFSLSCNDVVQYVDDLINIFTSIYCYCPLSAVTCTPEADGLCFVRPRDNMNAWVIAEWAKLAVFTTESGSHAIGWPTACLLFGPSVITDQGVSLTWPRRVRPSPSPTIEVHVMLATDFSRGFSLGQDLVWYGREKCGGHVWDSPE